MNMVWPALYVSAELGKFWYLVFATILIELVVIKVFLKFSWTKSFIASMVGNTVSGLVGIFLMMFPMILWHALVDGLVPNATFDIINWVATFILMCFGSVAVEALTIKFLYKESFKRLFLPISTGNLLTYVFIAYSMANPSKGLEGEVSADKVLYIPNKTHFTLLDSSNTVDLDTASIRISYDSDGKIINEKKHRGYHLWVKYKLMQSDSFDFHLRLIDDGWWGGTTSKGKDFPVDSIKDEFILLFEQRLMDSTAGYRRLQPTDTIKLIKLKTIRD